MAWRITISDELFGSSLLRCGLAPFVDSVNVSLD